MIQTTLTAAIAHPGWDPVAVKLGPLTIHWYALMYLAGFALAWRLAVRQTRLPFVSIKAEQIEDMIFYGAMGVILGGRVGYVFFYGFSTFLENPLWLFAVWDGGMSFHGGLLGVIFAMYLFARKHNHPWGHVLDLAAVITPVGLGLGRIGNFIGQELWGRPTDVPWAMVFPRDLDQLARHPSQLYQAFLEGLVLLALVYFFAQKERPVWAVSAVFLLGYASFRFFVEFFRQPDSHINLEWFGWMTRGQELCIPMFLLGIGLLWFGYRKQNQLPMQAAANSRTKKVKSR